MAADPPPDIEQFRRDETHGFGTSEIRSLPWELIDFVAEGNLLVDGEFGRLNLSHTYSNNDPHTYLYLEEEGLSLPIETLVSFKIVQASLPASTNTVEMHIYLTPVEPTNSFANRPIGFSLYQRATRYGGDPNKLNLYPYDERGPSETYVEAENILEGFNDRLIWARALVSDDGVRIKIWFDGDEEPIGWMAERTGALAPGSELPRYLAIRANNVGATGPQQDLYVDSLEVVRGLDAPPPACEHEQLTEYAPRAGAEIPISVRVDPRFIVPENRAGFADDADAIVEALQQRAEHALQQYASFGVRIPDDVTLEVVCDITAGLAFWDFQDIPDTVDGFTEAENTVKLRAGFVREAFKDAVRGAFPDAQDWTPREGWVNLVDHEMFHTTQHLKYGFIVGLGLSREGNAAVLVESSAVAAQDLIDDADDLAPADPNAPFPGSYLFEVRDGLSLLPSVEPGPHEVSDPADVAGEDAYHAAATFQYWGERFGQGATLEHKVADFIDGLLPFYGGSLGAVQDRMRPVSVFDALRDYYLALYALQVDAPNVTPALNRSYQLLDRDIAHGAADGLADGTAYPDVGLVEADLGLGPFAEDASLQRAQGRLYQFDLPSGARWLRVALTQPGAGAATAPLHAAFVPVAATDSLRFDRARMPTGMFDAGGPASSFVRVDGADRLAVVVATSQRASDYRLEVDEVSGPSTLEILSPTAADPDDYGVLQHAELRIEVRPQIGASFVSGLVAADFAVSLDGQAASVARVEPGTDRYVLFVRPGAPLAEGAHDLSVTFDAAADTEAGAIRVVGPQPGAPPEPSPATSAAGSFGGLGQGQSASTTALVTDGTQLGRFRIGWTGSEFDLTLTSPGGRVVTEDSTDPDVRVDEQPTSLTIDVEAPEPGEWQLAAVGVDVPGGPEPVSYAVEEFDTPLRAGLTVASDGEAGLPLRLSVGLAGPSGPLPGTAVRASVTDPAGVTRSWPLPDADHGGLLDDGLYGAELWATSLTGAYTIRVQLSGTLDGQPVTRVATTSVQLAPMLDGDGDGVADAVEARFGLDPLDASDGGIDHDADGRGLATELADGTDPYRSDSDGGGETDASELAGGRDPRLADDDTLLPGVWLKASPRDGNLMVVAAASGDASGSVRLVRIDASGARTTIGSVPGTGGEIVDGPLAAGDYRYAGIAVAANGAEGPPATVGPYPSLADATRPTAVLWLADGRYASADQNVSVRFSDLSEPVAEMRLASSREALASAAWMAFEARTSFTLPAGGGEHTVYAQLRDDSGLASPLLQGSIEVDTTPPASQGGPLQLLYLTSTIEVPFTASDDLGLAAVELWVRHRLTDLDPWGPWELAAVTAASPFSYAVAHGDGAYEFYTVAVDDAGNREAQPATPDAATRVLLSGLP